MDGIVSPVGDVIEKFKNVQRPENFMFKLLRIL